MGLTSATVTDTANASLDATFVAIAPIHLPLIFTGYGPLPAVVRTRDQTGNWDAAGQTRTVVLSGNSTAREMLSEYQRPKRFAYKVHEFTGLMRHLVKYAEGEWDFTESAGQTEITWSYRFIPTSRLAMPLVAIIAKVLWRGYMKKALRLALVQVSDHS